MLYAITIEPLNTMIFMYDRPEGSPWEVEEGVELEIDPLYGPRTPDRGPLDQTLFVSTADPKYFRVIQHSREIDREDYRPTGRHFGGLFTKALWERFVKTAPGMISRLRWDEDALDETEEALTAIERGG